MNILIDCCLVVSDSEPGETNFKQHVCDKNNFICWNQRQQIARRFETRESKGTAFRFCQEIESVIFRESTAGLNSFFKKKKKIQTKSFCKIRQSISDQTIRVNNKKSSPRLASEIVYTLV